MGGEGGVSEFYLRFQSYSFGNSGPHAKFQNRSLAPSRLKGVRWEELDLLVKLKASLASVEVLAGAVAKADPSPGLAKYFFRFKKAHMFKCKINMYRN